ncbi:reverse transcriptase family protein [Curtobacterium sp. RRHDQ10]|uniref:reverse transcriptase family protein n=1 Tax=Curtobacterium phyllosphaerae TaxID=3413379 RepID=UPI003BF33D16
MTAGVATILADVFLAADDWTVDALLAAGTAAVGPHRRFVPMAVLAALRGYPRAPRDAPRELAAFLQSVDGFAEAVRRSAARSPIVVASHPVVPAEAPTNTGHVPRIETVADLARLLDLTIGRLDWFADTKLWNDRARDDVLHHYGHVWRPRPGRVPRLLEVPKPRLRAVQRTALDEVLTFLPVHDAAHGFIPGRSAVTGAALHTGRQAVVALDLAHFFAAVSAPQVFGLLRRSGLSEPVAHTLTGLCTHVVPARVLAGMPPGGSPEDRATLRRALRTPHLPQGAPTSPTLANVSVRRLDVRLAGWAAAADATYTRYADDLVFSGDDRFAARVDAFVRGVGRIVADEGHTLNARKTRVRRQGVRQSVTGIVVNDRPSVGRAEFDRLKAILHNCVEHGPDGQDRRGVADFRAHLRGRVGWFEQVHPERGARLLAEFRRITW